MDDITHRDAAMAWHLPMPSEAEMIEALARSDAQIAAGQIVPGEVVMRELDECIARMEARRSGVPPRRTADHR